MNHPSPDPAPETSPGPSPRDLELLLAHEAWVRRLAGRLASSDHEADDLAQDTWLAALRARWSRRDRARAFLAGILRRRARERRRGERRRRDREAEAVRDGVAPSAVEALERAELGRELARLVLELEEPFRSTLLLSCVEGLSVAEVTARLGVPRKTVESRLARGHDRLRARWKRQHGDPGEARTSLALVAGALRTPTPSPSFPSPAAASSPGPAAPLDTLLGAMLVNTKLVLAAALLIGAGGLFWLATGSGEPTAATRAAAPALAARPAPLASPRAAPPTPVVASAERAPAGPESSAPVAQERPRPSALPAPAPHSLRGRVVDSEGRPLSGVPVAFAGRDGARATTRSDALGAFALEAPSPAGAGRVATADPALEDLFTLHARAHAAAGLLLVTARHRPLAGEVLGAGGEPVAGARVALELPRNFSARFDAVLDATDGVRWEATTGADGRFELPRAPVVEGSALVAHLDGYEPASLDPPPRTAGGLVLVLRRPQATEGTLAGRVVDPRGRPAAGALVSLGGPAATTDADGSFRLDRAGREQAFELVAVLPGHLPGRARATPDPVSGAPVWPAWVELVLGAEPRTLAGLVVDAGGRPAANVKLWLEDPTAFGLLGDDLEARLESLVAGDEAGWDASSDDHFRWTRTDAEGRFSVGGLLERDYSLGLFDRDTLAVTRAGPFAAGRQDLRIELEEVARRRVAGRLRTAGGAPIEGARVLLHAALWGGVHERGGERTTDAEGRFDFDAVAAGELSLWIRGEQVVPTVRPVAWSGDEEGELVVEALCHFKVDLTADPARADSLRAVDADGEPLELREIDASGVLRRGSWELVDGRSITLGVSSAAAALVLERDGVEVQRVPLHLVPGRLEVVIP